MDTIKDIILKAIKDKDNYQESDFDIAPEVLAFLENNTLADNVCDNVLMASISEAIKDRNFNISCIKSKLTTSFCLHQAYFYILFLKNNLQSKERERTKKN